MYWVLKTLLSEEGDWHADMPGNSRMDLLKPLDGKSYAGWPYKITLIPWHIDSIESSDEKSPAVTLADKHH